MTSPSVTYTFTNSTTADGTQVNQNFTDLINSMTDGTKTFSIDGLTVGGTALFNGPVTLGNATGDTITIGGYFSGSIIGSTTAGVPHAGKTDGGAVAASYIGQVITGTLNSLTFSNNTNADAGTVSLTPGIWMVYAKGYVSSPGSTHDASYACLSETSVTIDDPTTTRAVDTALSGHHLPVCPLYVNTSTNKTIYLVEKCVFTGTAPTTITTAMKLYAVRIS